VDKDRFDRNRLVEEAIARVGEDDFGDPSWQEGFDILLESIKEEARFNDLVTTVPTTTVTTTTVPSIDTAISVYGNCTSPSVEPAEIVLTCADYGEVLTGLHWTSWTATSVLSC
jgi:hypothetical protein